MKLMWKISLIGWFIFAISTLTIYFAPPYLLDQIYFSGTSWVFLTMIIVGLAFGVCGTWFAIETQVMEAMKKMGCVSPWNIPIGLTILAFILIPVITTCLSPGLFSPEFLAFPLIIATLFFMLASLWWLEETAIGEDESK